MLNFENELEILEENLTQDISWRKKELANLNNEIHAKFQLDNQEVSFLIRGSIALSYAHWEGSIKAQLSKYIDFLNILLQENYLELQDYDDEILDLIFQPTIKTLVQNKKEKRLKGIANFKQVYYDKNILKINSKEVINTKSNLSYEVLTQLFSIFKIIEIDSIHKTFIEHLLLDRNAIAHGEKRYSQINDSVIKNIKENSEKILTLIDQIKANIIEKAENYKK